MKYGKAVLSQRKLSMLCRLTIQETSSPSPPVPRPLTPRSFNTAAQGEFLITGVLYVVVIIVKVDIVLVIIIRLRLMLKLSLSL